ncbi:MAG: glycosyltransferase [Verrucomicrobia bacterium]|nr:glycosyltransferase [Verrucomicrobiota bacterium]
MKFLFLSDHAHLALDPAATRISGGSQLQVALLARELAGAGHPTTILGAETGQTDGEMMQGVRLRKAGRFDTGAVGATLRALPKMFRILREEKPDYVIVYGWTSLLFLLGILKRLLGCRLVFVCALDAEIDGGFRRENPIRGMLFGKGMELSDFRFGITRHQADLFHKRGMACEVTRLLLQKADFASGDNKAVDLLWVARCHPVKQPMKFLDLAGQFPSARCRMICSPQDMSLWQDVRARAVGMDNVDFIESAPYSEIQEHFNAARIFVNTSTEEGVPNTFIHAGLGRAAIASLRVDPDGMFGVFQAGFCAGDGMEALVSGTGRLLADPEELEKARSGAVRFVKEWHGNAANVEAFLNGLGKRPAR